GPDGMIIRYSYDPRGRLHTIADPLGGRTAFRYDAADRRLLVQYPNGTSAHYTYDGLGRLSGIRHEAQNGQVLASVEYALDRHDRRVSAKVDEELLRYAYDSEGQLLKEEAPEGTIRYAYDALGNRLETQGRERTVYEYDLLNRLVRAGKTHFEYDANGRVIRETEAGRTTAYAYDTEGHLTGVKLPDGRTYRYEYDALGNRTAWSGPGGIMRYLYDGEDVLAELSQEGKPVRTYLHGPGMDDLLGFFQGRAFYSVHTDGLGSTLAVADAGQKVVSRYKYTAFGRVKPLKETVPLDFLFTGARHDRETGFHYLRTRAYDPRVGRFTSPDVIDLAGGINLYAYVRNNPVNLIDPTGKIVGTT
ncbi:MAG: hypothetical protein IH628_12205, partial [Proteobacteria bacterium]|nr:hypothetical protein [Pseudomonadota bacterium]